MPRTAEQLQADSGAADFRNNVMHILALLLYTTPMEIQLHNELAAPTAPRAMPITHTYWFAMLAASAFGTNLGDLWADTLFPGRLTSLASLLVLCLAAVCLHRRAAARTEAGYWLAIIAMRAAATNLADIFTHDLALGYVLSSVLLAGLTLFAARYTAPDLSRSASPRVDSAYWIAMFIAGVFGTVAGDLIHHTIGMLTASSVLCVALAGLVLLREARAPTSMLLFWLIVMAERCAGTAVGDALASHRAIGLGVPIASVCSGILTMISLLIRNAIARRQQHP
jgi:uncharacterized membrane-anchored protein